MSMEERMTVCNMTIEAGARAGLDRARPDDVRLSPRPSVRAEGFRRGRRALAEAADRRRRDVRPHRDVRRRRDSAASHLGNHAGPSDRRRRPRARSERFRRSERSQIGRRGAGIHGPEARHADHVDPDRLRLHRLLHQRPHRRPAGRRGGDSRPSRRQGRSRPRRARQRTGQTPGRGRRARQDIHATPACEWREPGCSMCLAMNPDVLAPGERCAATSNRNFEGRQGKGGRTHLVSPAMAAAAAVAGHFVDVRKWE